MTTETMRNIRASQQSHWADPESKLPPHEPDTLLIGCIDARLNPKTDVGIPDGNALIHRTIAALIPPFGGDSNDLHDTIDYAVKTKKVRHLVIMGHTRCGGLEACLCKADEGLPSVHRHLISLKEARDAIAAGQDDGHQITRLEDESVRESIRHLKSYPAVAEALAAGALDLHGWVIDTATHELRELDKQTNEFKRMECNKPAVGLNAHGKADTIEAVRAFHRQPDLSGNPDVHSPEMLLISDLDARINPAQDLNIPYGKALIYRDKVALDSPVSVGKQAALQFAIEAKGVRDVVVMGHTENELFTGLSDTERLLRAQEYVIERVKKVKSVPVVAEAVAGGELRVHGWLIDTSTRHIFEHDEEAGQFVPVTMMDPALRNKPHTRSTSPGQGRA